MNAQAILTELQAAAEAAHDGANTISARMIELRKALVRNKPFDMTNEQHIEAIAANPEMIDYEKRRVERFNTYQVLSGLLARCNKFLAHNEVVEADEVTDHRTVSGTELQTEIIALRDEIETANARRQIVAAAVPTRTEVLAQAVVTVEAMCAHARKLLGTLNTARSDHASRYDVLCTAALSAPKEITQALVEKAQANHPEGAPVMARDAKEKELDALNAQIDKLERAECAKIQLAAEWGLTVLPRQNVSPAAYLGLHSTGLKPHVLATLTPATLPLPRVRAGGAA